MRAYTTLLTLGLCASFTAAAFAVEGAPRHVYVVNTGDGSVSLVDFAVMKELKRYKVGERPYGIAVTQDGKTAAVGVEGEEKAKFLDAADFTLKGAVPIGKMHNDHIILTQDGKYLLVANYYSDDVFIIDAAGDEGGRTNQGVQRSACRQVRTAEEERLCDLQEDHRHRYHQSD
jgi:YVTN family beta-propeller protein